jgi:hypothetical protein
MHYPGCHSCGVMESTVVLFFLRVILGGVCFQHFVIFISFWEIQKLDGLKSEKLEAPFHEFLSFSFLGPSNFWIS